MNITVSVNPSASPVILTNWTVLSSLEPVKLPTVIVGASDVISLNRPGNLPDAV